MTEQHHAALRYLIQTAGNARWNVIILAFLQGLLGICSVVYALLLKGIVNAAAAGQQKLFWQNIACFVALFLLQILLRALFRYGEEATRSTLENRLKAQLFDLLLNRDYAAVSAVHSGEWMNRLLSDTAICANHMTGILPALSGMTVRLAGAIGMLLILEHRFCYLVIPCGAMLIFFSLQFRKRAKQLHKHVQEQQGFLQMFLQEVLGSMAVVRAFAIETSTAKGAAEKMHAHKAARMKQNHFSNFCNMGFGLVMNGTYVAGAVICGYGILTGTMTYGNFTAVLQLIGQAQAPLANLTAFLPQYYAMLASGERLMEAADFAPRTDMAARPQTEIQQRYQHDLLAIELSDLWFSYPSVSPEKAMPPILHGLNLCINKGEYIAFTGQSGCGKSTVMKLLLALYQPDAGSMTLRTHTGCCPLDASWQRLFAYVPQGNHLMSGTIREVITMANPAKQQDDAAIAHALKIACADDFVYGLKAGLETPLGEKGQGLSEGQMQRLAVARAIFSDCPILLLDESTSALDAQTEAQLLANLRTLPDKTVLIVTHRPAALQICDRVISFSDAAVTEKCNALPPHNK